MSEHGYNLYHATGPSPDALDYAQPWAHVGPGATQVETGALDAATVHWFAIRSVDAQGREMPTAQDEIRLELDDQSRRVSDRPGGVLAPSARPLPHGAVRLAWRYRVGLTGVVPRVFRIFSDGGGGLVNYGTPLGEVPYRNDLSAYAWTSGLLAGGVAQQLAVRAIAVGDIWDDQPAVVSVLPDAAAPASVNALGAEALL
jgi:hypothetical protein